jgi:hypothetical protein
MSIDTSNMENNGLLRCEKIYVLQIEAGETSSTELTKDTTADADEDSPTISS